MDVWPLYYKISTLWMFLCFFGSFCMLRSTTNVFFFSPAASGQGKLCNWYCNDSPKSLMHCAKAAHCVFHSVNYLQERFSKVITLLSWLNAPRKSWEESLRINQPCLTPTFHLVQSQCETEKCNQKAFHKFFGMLRYAITSLPQLQNGSCSCMLMRTDRRHWVKVPSLHIQLCSLCQSETLAAQKAGKEMILKREIPCKSQPSNEKKKKCFHQNSKNLSCLCRLVFYSTVKILKNVNV